MGRKIRYSSNDARMMKDISSLLPFSSFPQRLPFRRPCSFIRLFSDNRSYSLNEHSAHFPAQIGSSIQEMIDQNGGANGMLGMAAGLMAKFMGGGGDGSRDGPGERTVAAGGTEHDAEIGHAGAIQQMIQKLLAPKILLLIQPYLQKFEAKMVKWDRMFSACSCSVPNDARQGRFSRS